MLDRVLWELHLNLETLCTFFFNAAPISFGFCATLVFSFRKHEKHMMSSTVYYHMLLKCHQTC